MTRRVVVTGIGLITPLGLDRKTTWDNLIRGRSGVDYISAFNAEGFETRIAAEVDDFNAAPILGRKESRRLDRFSQFACVSALEALEHAGLDTSWKDPDRVAVLVGSGVGGIITLSQQYDVLAKRGPGRVSPFLIPMMLSDMAAGQVSMMIGAKGPNFNTVSACASGADAIGEGAEMISNGRVDIALAGGSEAAVCPIGLAGFSACMALSKRNDDPQAASRPFDAGRDGFVLGEGAGIIVMEAEEHARERGAAALAEFAGYGATSDAHHVTQPDPQGEGAARAMQHALDVAGMAPEDVHYVNAHGTSTPLNDKFETMAVRRVFGKHADKLPVSSTKSMTGHLLGAAGGIESAFSVMAISESAIPPTINLEEPDPDCDLDYVPYTARRGRVASAMSNSLGFGGHNSSVLFREYLN